MRSSSPIMSDVALRAGVSRITVSRVFSQPETVSESTRRKVERAAAEIDFVPDRMAGALKSGVSNIVAVIVPSLRNSTFVATLQGLSDGLTKHGLVLSIGLNDFSRSKEHHVATELMSLKLRGLVLMATVHSAEMERLIKRARYPVVEVRDLLEESKGRTVSFSNKDASRAMTEHLIDRGYRNIAFATLPLDQSERAQQRFAGYREALQAARITYDPRLLIESDAGHKAGAATLAKLLDRKIPVDAFFGCGDVLAIGALLEARRRKMRIPQDLAIASFDDHDICEVTDPPLTSMMIPRYEIGYRCAELIVEAKTPVVQKRKVSLDLGFKLIVREST